MVCMTWGRPNALFSALGCVTVAPLINAIQVMGVNGGEPQCRVPAETALLCHGELLAKAEQA
jgi:hypothetical protein